MTIHPNLQAEVVNDVRDGAELQAMMDDAAYGEEVHVPFNTTYVTTSPLLIDSGCSLRVDGVIERQFYGKGDLATIRNRNHYVKSDDFQLYGSGTVRHGPGGFGKITYVIGDRQIYSDITLGPYSGGQAIIPAGDNCVIRNVRIHGSAAAAGTGGIRITSGVNWRVYDCHVESGDDTLQVVTLGYLLGPDIHAPCSNVRYLRCTGFSSAGRFLAFAVENDSNSICSDIAIRQCHGWGSKRVGIFGKLIGPGTGIMTNVLVEDCNLALSNYSESLDGVIIVDDIAILNIDRLTLRRVTLSNAINEWFRCSQGSSNVVIEDCTFYPHRVPPHTGSGCQVVDTTNVTIQRSTFQGGGVTFGIYLRPESTGAKVLNNNVSAVTSSIKIRNDGVGSTVSGNA